LGLIIVDEEHEGSFKQDITPRYHARDVAVCRASREGALALLGSATPSLETWRNAMTGKYEKVELPRRINNLPMPPVEIVDLGVEMQESKGRVVLGGRLRRAVNSALERREQVILFLNRRGFATSIQCPKCGFVLKCHQCDAALTYHRTVNLARCHYCLHEEPPPEKCPACGQPNIKQTGLGTQRAEDSLAKMFPGRVIVRMDTDTMRGRGKHREALDRVQSGEADILLGTQMIAKGLDFPNVTVVGVINADTALNMPDFRAAERCFQLLAQVAGRAGRGPKGGIVFVQTFSPNHPCIRAAAAHDYAAFAAMELVHRKEFGYPPFTRLARIVCEAKTDKAAEEEAAAIASALCDAGAPHGAEVLGPAPAAVSRLRGKSRWHMLVKAPTSQALHHALDALGGGRSRGVQVTVDVDPVNML